MSTSLSESHSKTGALSAEELNQLNEFLLSIDGSDADVESLDGFLTALVVGSDRVERDEYWPLCIGTKNHQFVSAEESKRIFGLIDRHWNSIFTTLSAGEVYAPVLIEHDDPPRGKNWAAGFITATNLRYRSWMSFMDNDASQLLMPILMLAFENHPDPLLCFSPLDWVRRRQVLVCAEVALPKIFRIFQDLRKLRHRLAN